MNISNLKTEITNIRDRLLYIILCETGCALSEISNIKIKHISISKKKIIIPKENTKNNQKRKIKLSNYAISEFKLFSSKNQTKEYLFSSRQSNKLTSRRIEQIIRQITKRLRKQKTPRDIRNEFLLKQTNISNDKKKIQKSTGLKNIKQPLILSESFIKKLKFENLREDLIFSILCETGCKISEFVNIKVNDYSDKKINLCEKKEKRIINISKKLSKKILKYINEKNEKDFLISGKKKLSPRRVQQILKEYSKKYKITITPRIVRNSFLYHSYNAGTKIEELKQIMGLKKINLFTHGIL